MAVQRPSVGKRMGSVGAAKRASKKGKAGPIKFIPADDSVVVRFMTEPDDWWGYDEYFNEDTRTFVPVMEGDEVPPGTRTSFRFLACALLLPAKEVVAIKLPKDLGNKLIRKAERYKTIMDRDYELSRMGKGQFDTEYDCDPMDKLNRPMTKYKALDLGQVLLDAHAQALGQADDDDDDDEDERPTRTVRKVRRSGSRVQTRRQDDDEDDEEDERPTRSKTSRPRRPRR